MTHLIRMATSGHHSKLYTPGGVPGFGTHWDVATSWIEQRLTSHQTGSDIIGHIGDNFYRPFN